MGRVDGKIALVTGAARGQGRSHATRLAEEGADIIAVDICAQIEGVQYEMPSPSDLKETVRLVEALGRRVVAAEVDVRDFSALERAAAAGVTELGQLDIVIANAGITTYGLLSEMSDEHWQTTIDVNLTGVWHTVKAALPHLKDGSSIVITSSTAGLKGFQHIGHYSASKHGLVGLMRSLAHELGERRIRVNTVHPTQVNTEMLLNEAAYRMFRPDLPDPGPDDIAPISQMMMVIPIPWVEPIDISNAALFLASDEARYITGVALPVDAGAAIK